MEKDKDIASTCTTSCEIITNEFLFRKKIRAAKIVME